MIKACNRYPCYNQTKLSTTGLKLHLSTFLSALFRPVSEMCTSTTNTVVRVGLADVNHKMHLMKQKQEIWASTSLREKAVILKAKAVPAY